ncbi:MAG: penicillin acylase family protein [Haliangiales bacterium]
MLRRRILWAVGIVVAALVCVAVAGWLYLRTSVPDLERDGHIAGLAAAVEVWRDEVGVPHLWAESELDLMRAMGYVHAQDRLWQMELFRRVTQGRLAEILGPDLLQSDRFLRTVGMRRSAEADLAVLLPDERALLDAYADGVNAWQRERSGALPPEFLALGVEPAPWTAADSLAIAKAMAWDLSNWQTELRQQQIADGFDAVRARQAEPEYPDWGPVTMPTVPPALDREHIAPGAEPGAGEGPAPDRGAEPDGDAALDGETDQPSDDPQPSDGAQPSGDQHGSVLPPAIPGPARELLASMSIARASNFFVVAGERTRSGKPILANDMHLSLRVPSLWYIAALHGGGDGIDVAGMTIPGVPFVLVGRNRHLTWGLTSSQVDVADYFIERLDPEDPSRYLTPAGSEPFDERVEVIAVADAEPVEHIVRSTRHGPVFSDVEPRAGERVLALRWTGHEPSTNLRAVRGMNRAADVAAFEAALALFSAPVLNVAYADTAGNIGFRTMGHIPVRRAGDGLRPAPGWTDSHEWTGYLTPEQVPRAFNPAEGFLVNSNNRQASARYRYFLTRRWASPFRALRLQQLIEGSPPLTVELAVSYQEDQVDTFARRYLPVAIASAQRAGQDAAARALEGWDGDAGPDSHAAALFYVWFSELSRATYEDELAGQADHNTGATKIDDRKNAIALSAAAIMRMIDTEEQIWADDIRTPEIESLEDISDRVWPAVVEAVGERRWGELHTVLHRHPLGVSGALNWLLGLHIGPAEAGGSGYTVDAMHLGSGPPYQSTFGTTQRQVVDLSDADGTGHFLLPTGQSGVPLSPHYRDQNAMWGQGALIPVPLSRAGAEARAVYRSTLRPR